MEYDWYATDLPENFETNPNKELWSDVKIKYIVNEKKQTRIDPIEELRFKRNCYKNIACFGCSNTFGVGLPLNATWPYKLKKLFGKDYTYRNFGVSGASIEEITHHIYNEILNSDIKYDVIFIFFPDPFRYVYYNSDKFPERVTPCGWFRDGKKIPLMQKHNHYDYLTSEKDTLFRFIKNFKIIEEMLKQKNVKFYWGSWSDDINNLYNILSNVIDTKNTFNREELSLLKDIKLNKPLARDNIHFGIEYFDKVAELFYQKTLTP